MTDLLAPGLATRRLEHANKTQHHQVSVVIPLYNEIDCIPHLLSQVARLSASNPERDYEFVFVDDGSIDGTGNRLKEALVDDPRSRVLICDENRGIAAAIQTGIRAASHEVIASIDADGSYDLALLDQMIPQLTEGVDMVTASPYHPDGDVENVPAWRLWLSKQASTLYRLRMKQNLHCCTSCFRVYRRSAVFNLRLDHDDFVGVAELAWRMDRQNSTIVEHPAVLRTRIAGHSKMRVARTTVRHLRFLAKSFFTRA